VAMIAGTRSDCEGSKRKLRIHMHSLPMSPMPTSSLQIFKWTRRFIGIPTTSTRDFLEIDSRFFGPDRSECFDFRE
jgi:hypothetical protein